MKIPDRHMPWFRQVLMVMPLVSGCHLGPGYRRPDLTAATTLPWRAKALEAETTRIRLQAERVARWWTQFGDDELARLIAELSQQNLSLAEARRRVVAVRAARCRISAEHLPRVDGTSATASFHSGPQHSH